MNDVNSLTPANGSHEADRPPPDAADEGEPSLAPMGDHELVHQAHTDLSLSSAPLSERMDSVPAFPSHSLPTGIPAPAIALSPLEERLRRLEDALAQVPDPKQIETRIADLVAERLTIDRAVPVAQIAPAAPAGVQGVTIPTGMILDVGKRILNSTAGMARPASGSGHTESALSNGVRRTVLFFDLLTEARAVWCMYTDPRYKLSWAGRLVPLALGGFLLTSAFLVPGASLTGIGTIIDKLADLIPAFIFFKLLSYEARRYRETAPDLPTDLRL